MEAQITQNCENCQKPFPVQKIDLHEAYCRRNFRRCGECFKMYDFQEQQLHKQQHAKKSVISTCPHCKKQCPGSEFEAHIANCSKRPVYCKFCQNQYAFGEIVQHEEGCGSRTKTCQTCGKYIKIRQYAQHSQRCRLKRQTTLRRNGSIEVVINVCNRGIANISQRERISSNDRKKNESPQKQIQKHGKKQIKELIPPQKIKTKVDIIPICIKKALNKDKSNRQIPQIPKSGNN